MNTPTYLHYNGRVYKLHKVIREELEEIENSISVKECKHPTITNGVDKRKNYRKCEECNRQWLAE